MVEDRQGWAEETLRQAEYRTQGLHQALTTRLLDLPESDARTSFIEQCLAELRGIEGDLLSLQDAVGASPGVTTALQAVADDRARILQFSASTDPIGVRPEMTWAEGFRQLEIMEYVRALVHEIREQVRPEADNPLGTLFRSDGPYRAAQSFAQTELAGRIEALTAVAARFADETGPDLMADRYPGFDYKVQDPPPEFQMMVRGLLQELAPILFQMDSTYVAGDLFQLLAAVYAETRQVIGGELGLAAVRLVIVNLVFLGGQLPPFAIFAASLPRGSVACEALVRSASILMTAAHRSGPGKIPPGYQRELDALQFYVDNFLKALVGRLAAAEAPAG
jgi:hypothetical protein